jgi:lipopolysaccharide export system permease protein
MKRFLFPTPAQAAQALPPPRGQPPRTATSLPYVTQQTGAATTAYAQRLRAARQRAAIYEVEIQKKLAIAAACVIFALLGMPLAIRFPRGGVGLVIGTSLAVFSVYYVGLIGGEELGDRLIVDPFLAMWTPNLIFLLFAIPLLWMVRRAGSTAHGGDWDEVKHALFGWTRRLKLP